MSATVETLTEEKIHTQLQSVANRYPADYQTLYDERTNPTRDYCCSSHLLDFIADGDWEERKALEVADDLLWLAGVY